MDFFKGPEYKANVQMLEAELNLLKSQSENEQIKLRQQFQEEIETLQKKFQSVQDKYFELEAKIKENGILDLVEIQQKIQREKDLLSSIKSKVIDAESELRTEIKNKIEEEKKILSNTRSEVFSIQQELAKKKSQLQELRKQILGAEETILLESFCLYEPKYQFINSGEYKQRLDEIREEQKLVAKRLGATVDTWETHAVQLTGAEWKKLRKDTLKLALRSFNSESEYCIDNVKFNNVDKMEARIRRSFETCNSLLKIVEAWWTESVLERRLKELYLAHEYQVKRQEEKEAIRQAKEEQREQAKLEKEIREARAKIEKERQHFLAALQKLQARLAAANDEQERAELQGRIDELANLKGRLDEEERLLDYREQNARAGYIYVISNIGAFGEGVYKIGMTRRLEPMERIDELGDASVPFRFDVHALVFSDNAPALEAKLHAHFASGRLNKINNRKEFFRADIKEIEAVIRANYDAVVEVVHTPPAEQYRESIRLEKPLSMMDQKGPGA